MSNHYGFTYGAKHNWLVLVAIMVAGALIRLSFALRHKALACGEPVPWCYAIAGTLLLDATVGATMPAPRAAPAAASAAPATFAQVQDIVTQRCVLCHGPALQSKNVRPDRRHQPPRAADRPAISGAQADADEQRHPDHRRRARADPALVRGRRPGELTPACWRAASRSWARSPPRPLGRAVEPFESGDNHDHCDRPSGRREVAHREARRTGCSMCW